MSTVPAQPEELRHSKALARKDRLDRPKARTFIGNLLKFRTLYLMLLPGALYLLINNYVPMFGVLIAFKNMNYADGFLHSEWIGFKNFEFLFATSDAWVITRNTIFYNIVFIALNLILAVGAAILLNEVKNRILSRMYQSFMLFPYFISMVIVGYLVYSLLSIEYGFLNKMLVHWFGREAISWYSEAKYWPYILTIVNAWKQVGYYSVIYLAAIIGFDHEYYEAARIDGAGKWQQMTRITLPMLTPIVVLMTLLQVGRIFYADFGLFYQVTLDSGTLMSTTNVIDTYVYRALLKTGDIGMSSAAGLYQAVVGFFIVYGANFLVRKFNRDNALF